MWARMAEGHECLTSLHYEFCLFPLDSDENLKTHVFQYWEPRKYKNGLASVKNMFVLNFSSTTRQGKKGGNFKTSMRFTETNPFLYCLSSSCYFDFPPFPDDFATSWTTVHGKGKRSAISKLARVSQKRIRSYIVLALGSRYKKVHLWIWILRITLTGIFRRSFCFRQYSRKTFRWTIVRQSQQR